MHLERVEQGPHLGGLALVAVRRGGPGWRLAIFRRHDECAVKAEQPIDRRVDRVVEQIAAPDRRIEMCGGVAARRNGRDRSSRDAGDGEAVRPRIVVLDPYLDRFAFPRPEHWRRLGVALGEVDAEDGGAVDHVEVTAVDRQLERVAVGDWRRIGDCRRDRRGHGRGRSDGTHFQELTTFHRTTTPV